MLPEKRKKLIITIIAIVLILITILLLGKISSYIKNRNDENTVKEKRNDAYPSNYDYIGLTLDNDNIYKLFGIGKTEEYLNIRTFYNIKDETTINKKIVLYSDATNELRYDSKLDEFYFYELDSVYYKNDNIKLMSDNIIIYGNNKISYKKYNSDKANLITEDAKNNTILTKNNKIYYLLTDGIHEYDLNTNTDKCIIYLNEEINLINITNNYLITNNNFEYIVYKIDGAVKINLKDYIDSEFEFIDITDNGILINQNNELKEFSFITNKILKDIYSLDGYNITSSTYLNNDIYYMILEKDNNKKYVIIDMNKLEIIKEFNNNYSYIWRLNEN